MADSAIPGMKGADYYNQHSSVQEVILDGCLPIIFEALHKVLGECKTDVLSLIDYGSSEGKNSAKVIKTILDKIGKSAWMGQISVVHNDLPTNDFNSLMQNVYLRPEVGYLTGFESESDSSLGKRVFSFASGKSFYSQVVPDNTINLGISSLAMHWFSKVPAHKGFNGIYAVGLESGLMELFSSQANDDLVRILTMRHKELATGGRFVMTVLGQTSKDQTISLNQEDLIHDYSSGWLITIMNRLAGEMVLEGLIEQDTLSQYVMPLMWRSEENVRSIYEDDRYGLKHMFALEYLEVNSFDCPMYSEYQRTSDAQKYAQKLTGFVRAWAEPSMTAGLFSGNDKLTQDYFARLEKAVLSSPEDCANFPSVLTLVVKKK